MTLFRSFSKTAYRYGVYALVSMFIAVGIGVMTPQPAQAGWIDLLLGGARALQLSNMSDSQEMALGADINRQLINSGQINIYDGPSLNGYVDEIGGVLAAASDRPNLTYNFQIVEDEAVNAFAVPGGFIYLTTGLMAAADTEAELAGVIGHEIGHVAGKHSLKQMRQVAITQGITGALGVNRDRLVNIGTQIALQLPASRSDEYEADRHGFYSMGRAGYDQSGMASFMQKLVTNRRPPEFLSTHPDARNRVSALQDLDQAEALPEATFGTSESDYAYTVRSLR